MIKLRLVLGDQLNLQHSWFSNVDDEVVYVMAEMRQETDYVKHHIQKVVGFFIAMRSFANTLQDQGHQLKYYTINDSNNPQNLATLIQQEIDATNAQRFEYQLPDEYRLDQQLQQICKDLTIASEAIDTEHFYTSRTELADFFKGKKQLIMESFYRMMRKNMT